MVLVEGDADVVEEPVADAVSVAELVGVDAVRVAMLMVVFLGRGVPVAALTLPSGIGMVVDAVPLAEMVLLMYAAGIVVDMAFASAP